VVVVGQSTDKEGGLDFLFVGDAQLTPAMKTMMTEIQPRAQYTIVFITPDLEAFASDQPIELSIVAQRKQNLDLPTGSANQLEILYDERTDATDTPDLNLTPRQRRQLHAKNVKKTLRHYGMLVIPKDVRQRLANFVKYNQQFGKMVVCPKATVAISTFD
jgi:hypothetical protein